MFATYEADGFTGLNDAVNRWYPAGTGRFASADPYQASAGASDPGSWNRYSYVQGDPANHTDPTGLYMADCDYEDCAADEEPGAKSQGGGGGGYYVNGDDGEAAQGLDENGDPIFTVTGTTGDTQENGVGVAGLMWSPPVDLPDSFFILHEIWDRRSACSEVMVRRHSILIFTPTI